MEEKDVQRLIDMLYNMIDEAKSVAFNAEKCTINRDEALDILDEIRSKLPLELKKAKELIAARNDYVAGAKKEVEKMMRQAELDAKTIVSESEVIQQARQKSADIIRRAEERSRELPHGGGHPDRAGRGTELPHTVPRRLSGADAGGPEPSEAGRAEAESPELNKLLPSMGLFCKIQQFL